MNNYRPLFFQKLNIRVSGIQVRRLSLNRHLSDVDQVAPHAHTFTQLLLYLGGSGFQQVDGEDHPVRSGTLLLIPPRQTHAFRETSERRPLCLVLDVTWSDPGRQRFLRTQMNQSDLARIRQSLSHLTRLPNPDGQLHPIETGISILQILDVLARQSGLLPTPPTMSSPLVKTLDRLLQATPDLALRELAARAGYQMDYLNRILKQSTGLTLGQYRAEKKIAQAKKLLSTSRKIQDTAATLGFLDQNYFSRWFRQHTGLRPRDYLPR